MHQNINEGSIFIAPVGSVYFGTTLPSASTIVAGILGSALVGSTTVYIAFPPVIPLMALSSPFTIELIGPLKANAEAGCPFAPTPCLGDAPQAPIAMEARVTTTAKKVTIIKSIFHR